LAKGQVRRFIVTMSSMTSSELAGRQRILRRLDGRGIATPFPTPFLLTDGVDWGRAVSLWCD
jgi:hypothetical protein